MRAVIQRCLSASVEVESEVVSSIGQGLVVLVGIAADDNEADMEYIARKCVDMRVFSDAESGKPWDKSCGDLNLPILFVSQFTLMGYLKGNRPDFHRAMAPTAARTAYEAFLAMARTKHSQVFDGRFGAMMKVNIVNDGPFTITLDSKDRETANSK